LAGCDPILAILIAGIIGALVAVPAARIIFRLSGAYLAVGACVLAEMFRLLFARAQPWWIARASGPLVTKRSIA
jgi:branched-chain amino acid transport system permease protein